MEQHFHLITKEPVLSKRLVRKRHRGLPRASTINLRATLLRIVLFWMEKIPRLVVDNLLLKFPRQFFQDGRAYLDAVWIQALVSPASLNNPISSGKLTL